MELIIPHMRVKVEEEAIAAVTRVMESGHLAMGKMVRALEDELVTTTGHKEAMAVSSGSAALHLALLAVKREEQDEVILPDYTCISLYNAVLMAGMVPRLVDIDENTATINVDQVKNMLTFRTRAVIVPHMFGHAADLDALMELGITVIEDCAHAVGGLYKGRKLGGIGHLGVFSFYATKMICGAEGGAVTCQDQSMAEHIRDLRDYTGNKTNWRLRYNYKLSDIHAAIALVHLRHLGPYTKRRRELAYKYNQNLDLPGIILPREENWAHHTYYRYLIRNRGPGGGNTLRNHLEESGIGTGAGVLRCIHQEVKLMEDFPVSSSWQEQGVSLPIYPSLADAEQEKVIKALQRAIETI